MENEKVIELLDQALVNSYNTTLLFNILDELVGAGVKLQQRTAKIDFTIMPTERVQDILNLDVYRRGTVDSLRNSKYVSVQAYYPSANKIGNVMVTELTADVLKKVLGAVKLNNM